MATANIYSRSNIDDSWWSIHKFFLVGNDTFCYQSFADGFSWPDILLEFYFSSKTMEIIHTYCLLWMIAFWTSGLRSSREQWMNLWLREIHPLLLGSDPLVMVGPCYKLLLGLWYFLTTYPLYFFLFSLFSAGLLPLFLFLFNSCGFHAHVFGTINPPEIVPHFPRACVWNN